MLFWFVLGAILIGQVFEDFRLRKAERALKLMLQSQLKQSASVAGLEAGAIIDGQSLRELRRHCCDSCRDKVS